MKIFAVAEQRQGKWNPVSWETLVAAQQLAEKTSAELCAVLAGSQVAGLADELAAKRLGEVLLLDHPLLEPYTADGFSIALRRLIEQTSPDLVLLPHTYQVRDFAPKLAASLGKGFVGDCVGYRWEEGRIVLVRQMFQGRANADVTFAGPAPWFASFQAGAFRSDQVASREAGQAPVRKIEVDLKPEQIRTRPLELFREAKQAVDLTQAPIIVSVGRGIKEQANIPLAEELAKLLGGEIAASRPICDEGWLPMDRQIGSSGQTVAPKLYLALGISGAIQHVVGMKGSRTVVAVNKDRNAPIFEIADYGVVGDLFEIVPALIACLQKS
ncbi:MAG TPA: electron transfer flavoprotein subunit alpha/FixB family protein [Patescibacteria group bacterium]|nr:electron transfer flavoprotein subunit alpha/FixB family protein [Patescibacteria group bacterium]